MTPQLPKRVVCDIREIICYRVLQVPLEILWLVKTSQLPKQVLIKALSRGSLFYIIIPISHGFFWLVKTFQLASTSNPLQRTYLLESSACFSGILCLVNISFRNGFYLKLSLSRTYLLQGSSGSSDILCLVKRS